jgi:TonB family protein
MYRAIRRVLRQGTLPAIVAGALLLWAASADAATCPVRTQSLLAMPDGKSYAVLLNSDVKRSTDVRLTLYSTEWSYTVTLPAVSFARKMPDNPYPLLRSLARFTADTAFVTLPRPDTLLAVRADPGVGAAPAGCDPTYAYTLEIDLYRFGPRFVASRGSAAAGRAIVASFNPSTPAVAASVVAAEPELACAEPYAIPRTLLAAPANYPPEARAAGQTGLVIVAVDLGPNGAVENTNIVSSTAIDTLTQEAVKAAKATKYAPELFRCQAVAGTYLFRVGYTLPPR